MPTGGDAARRHKDLAARRSVRGVGLLGFRVGLLGFRLLGQRPPDPALTEVVSGSDVLG